MNTTLRVICGIFAAFVIAACGDGNSQKNTDGTKPSAHRDGGNTDTDASGNNEDIDGGSTESPDANTITDGGDGGHEPTCSSTLCDDGVACTDDVCDDWNQCEHITLHARCEQGSICDAELDCVSPPICATVADCPDLDGPCLQESCDVASATCVYTPLDSDGDSHSPQICITVGGDDCDDNDPTVYPNAPELCDGLDNDCDGTRDNFEEECDATAIGVCTTSVKTCTNGQWSTCARAVGPSPEVCDGLDNDCDGETDEDLGPATCNPYISAACDHGIPHECDCTDGIDNDHDGLTDLADNHDDCQPVAWQPISSVNAPDYRSYTPQGPYSVTASDADLFLWGGANANDNGVVALNTGARYNLATDTWSTITTQGAPSPRFWHSAVWIGSKLCIWGGTSIVVNAYTDAPEGNNGACYDPANDRWTPIATNEAIPKKIGYSAFWTGSEIAVVKVLQHEWWLYNPSTETWRTRERFYNNIAWSCGADISIGNTVISWNWNGCRGWWSYGSYITDMSPHAIIVNATDGTWYLTSSIPNPANDAGQSQIVSASTHMVVVKMPFVGHVTLWAYDLAADTWEQWPVDSGVFPGPFLGTAIWNGHELILWGQCEIAQYQNTKCGAIYNPTERSWRQIPISGSVAGNLSYYSVLSVPPQGDLIEWTYKYDERDSAIKFVGAQYHP